MPRKIAAPIAATIALAGVSVPAEAKAPKTMCQRASAVRHDVARLHGKRAPGRDICRWGVKTKHGTHFPKLGQRARYLRALRVLVTPPKPAYLARIAVPPPQPPAGTLTAGVAPTGQAACIVARESGGNPQATNGQYHGIAQWSHEAWIRHGGGRYASDPLGATKQQQLQVLGSALSRYGSGDWSPYDGC
jgi:hypothetical protein